MQPRFFNKIPNVQNSIKHILNQCSHNMILTSAIIADCLICNFNVMFVFYCSSLTATCHDGQKSVQMK